MSNVSAYALGDERILPQERGKFWEREAKEFVIPQQKYDQVMESLGGFVEATWGFNRIINHDMNTGAFMAYDTRNNILSVRAEKGDEIWEHLEVALD